MECTTYKKKKYSFANDFIDAASHPVDNHILMLDYSIRLSPTLSGISNAAFEYVVLP
jgi:hypothetical protein